MAGLTVAVTGPTGEIGKSLIDALEASPKGKAVRGLARSAFDPAGAGWTQATCQRGRLHQAGPPGERLRGHVLGRRPIVRRILRDGGVPLQLVHHDDVAVALAAATEGKGEPGAYNLAGDGEIQIADIARALGWRSVRVPRPALGAGTAVAGRLSFINPQLDWATPLTTPGH